MKYRRRIYYTAAQRAEIWDRWQRGESMSSIGRRFDRESSSVFSVISPTGGIRPTDRKRGRLSLSLSEREEISRGLSVQRSLRAIASSLGAHRQLSAGKSDATVGLIVIGRQPRIRRHGIGRCVRSYAGWLVMRP